MSAYCSTGPGLKVLPLDFMPPTLIAQLVKNPPAMQETPVRFLGREDPLEKGYSTHSSILGLPCGSAGKESAGNAGHLGSNSWLGKIPWRRERLPTPVSGPGEFHGLYSPWAPHSSTLAWKIPRTEEPGRLQSMGSLRVGHD